MTAETMLRVRYQETDAMGVAHHAAYFAWFELGRSDLIRSAGRSYAEFEKEGLFLPVVEANARYHAPARYDEMLRLETSVLRLDRVRITFGYTLYGATEGEMRAEGATRHALIDRENRPVRIPDWIRELLGGHA